MTDHATGNELKEMEIIRRSILIEEAVAAGKRKVHHPESMGFQLQVEGWTDEEIDSNVWLAK